MPELTKYITLLDNKRKRFSENLEKILVDNREIILEILKRRLYVTGLPDYEYSETTKDIKYALGLPEDHVTLFHTGTLYKSFRLQYINGIISVYQDDAILASYPKTNYDDMKPGEAYFGSTTASEDGYDYPLILMQEYGYDIFDFEIEEQERIVRDFIDKGLNKYINDKLEITLSI